MKILILGADGMIGHCMFKHLRLKHDVRGTLHHDSANYRSSVLFDSNNIFFNLDVVRQDQVSRIMEQFGPDIVINATGIIKQRAESYSVAELIEVNALVPHRLVDICAEFKARLMQFSTDCVFSGKKGSYSENDIADAEDVYGRTKYLGEVNASNCLTIRTSSIGLEIGSWHGLIEWFLRQTGTICGFTKAIYSGITTIELARVVDFVIVSHADMDGLWHVAVEPISKYELLNMLAENLGLAHLDIKPDDSFVCDRSLQGGRFLEHTGYKLPSWHSMLKELSETIISRANKEEL